MPGRRLYSTRGARLNREASYLVANTACYTPLPPGGHGIEPCCLVLTTAGSDEQARALARALVEERLAACVNVVPRVVSVYRWRGSVEEEYERLLVVKTAARLFERVRERIRELHPYELPEVVRIPIEGGDPEYLAWIGASVAPEES